MDKQIESVLTTALGEKNELEFDQSKIDLNTLILNIDERMKLQLEANDATLILHIIS